MSTAQGPEYTAPEVPDRPRYPVPAPGVVLAPIVTLALIVILSFVAPVSFLPLGVSLGVGIPLLVVGVGLFGWAQASLLGAGETPAPYSTARLVSRGAYRLSRNPIYTGGVTALFGLAVLLDTATGLAVVVLLLALLARSVALAEEHYLEAKFGDEYREYRSRVRRWI